MQSESSHVQTTAEAGARRNLGRAGEIVDEIAANLRAMSKQPTPPENVDYMRCGRLRTADMAQRHLERVWFSR